MFLSTMKFAGGTKKFWGNFPRMPPHSWFTAFAVFRQNLLHKFFRRTVAVAPMTQYL